MASHFLDTNDKMLNTVCKAQPTVLLLRAHLASSLTCYTQTDWVPSFLKAFAHAPARWIRIPEDSDIPSQTSPETTPLPEASVALRAAPAPHVCHDALLLAPALPMSLFPHWAPEGHTHDCHVQCCFLSMGRITDAQQIVTPLWRNKGLGVSETGYPRHLRNITFPHTRHIQNILQ